MTSSQKPHPNSPILHQQGRPQGQHGPPSRSVNHTNPAIPSFHLACLLVCMSVYLSAYLPFSSLLLLIKISFLLRILSYPVAQLHDGMHDDAFSWAACSVVLSYLSFTDRPPKPLLASLASSCYFLVPILPPAAFPNLQVEGPPTFLDPEAIRPLATSELHGLSDEQAALLAGPSSHGIGGRGGGRQQPGKDFDISRLAPPLKGQAK
ncbi:hypothetical protein Vafri_3905 [Volvox africanus]|nr:hypothetical protein Vafri_3905 [Volvox africanus]